MQKSSPKTYSNLIDGEWKTTQGREFFEDRNPADYADVVGLLPMATRQDAQDAIGAARAALPGWANTPAPARGAILDKASQIITAKIDEMASVLTREEGKTLGEAKGEITRARDIFRYYGGEGWRQGGQVLPG